MELWLLIELVELGGENLLVKAPVTANNDVFGGMLDVLTFEVMLRELKVFQSLAVRNLIWDIELQNRKHQHDEGRPLRSLPRNCKDFAQSADAAQLDISSITSLTSSAETLRTFMVWWDLQSRMSLVLMFRLLSLRPLGRR